MLNNVLVPLDGSRLAEAALPYARAIASRTGATLTLVRASQSKSPLGDLTIDALQQTIASAEGYLATLSTDLHAHGFTVQTSVPYAGSAAEWIVEVTGLRHADLIVMATHDRVGPDRWVHGSVAETVVHNATVPVMLVLSEGAEELAQRFQSGHAVVVVPLDGSELADAALPCARTLAQVLGGRVVLVAVVPEPGQLVAGQAGAIITYTGSEHATLEAEAWAYLEASVGRVGGKETDVETVVRCGDVASEIAAVAREYAAAVVVMATHGRTGLVRSILGSVAGGVVHHCSTPVMLIRPPELQPAQQPLLQQATTPA